MRALCVLFGTATIAAALLCGCGSSSPTGGNPLGTGAPSIYATLDWTIVQTKLFQSLGIPVETTVTASVSVNKSANAPDSAAVVSVVLHGISYPLSWSSAAGHFTTTSAHKIPVTAVKNGDAVTVTVTSGGKTYTDAETMPGGISVADDGTGATWLREGNQDQLAVYPLNAMDIPDIANPVFTVTPDMDSPVSIGQSAMTSGQWYEAVVIVEQDHVPFAGANVVGSVSVRQSFMKDFQKP